MKRLLHTAHAQHSRRFARARVAWCGATMVSADYVGDGAVAMLGTLVTTKINPSWVLGGLPREGIS
jgi:hypothetical protein